MTFQSVVGCNPPRQGRNILMSRPLLYFPAIVETPGPMFITKPFITNRRLRFALVGCGRISANHFDAIEKHAERAEIVGVADIDPAALDRAAARTGAPGFPTLQALLAGCDADVVILATPSGINSAQAIAVAAAG